MFEKTVREVALEARVADLQRENDLLKRVATGDMHRTVIERLAQEYARVAA